MELRKTHSKLFCMILGSKIAEASKACAVEAGHRAEMLIAREKLQSALATREWFEESLAKGLAGVATREQVEALASSTNDAFQRGENELDYALKKRAELAVKMVDLKETDPALWKFVEAWVAGRTQKEVAARYNQKNGTKHNQSWVAKQLGKLRERYPALTIDPAGGGRFHNPHKAKQPAGNRVRTGDGKTELQREPEGGWVGENDL